MTIRLVGVLLFIVNTLGVAQGVEEKPIETVNRIFKDYVQYSESTDAREDKEAMIKALQELQVKHEAKDLDLLINVWMYYDPTDFSGRVLIMKIFEADRQATRKAIDKRIKNKEKWENRETAPYSELFTLREEFLK